MPKVSRTWRQWAWQSPAHWRALKAWRAADVETQQELDPSDFLERYALECPRCGLTHLMSQRRPRLICRCGFFEREVGG